MAPPTKPTDPPTPPNPEAHKPDEHLNLLDLWKGVKQNAIAPGVNSFAIEPANVAVNVVNGISDGFTWCVNKTGTKFRSPILETFKAPELGKVQELEVGKPTNNEVGYYTQQIFGTAGSFLAYAVAGKIAGKALRTVGELTPLELEIRNLKVGSALRGIAQDTRVASVLGATVYAGLKDPKDGESRFSNAASTFIGFSAFEAGNSHLVSPGAPMAFRLGQRYYVGAFGGMAQANVASMIQDHWFAGKEATAAAGFGGGLLNAIMPHGRVIVDAVSEARPIKGLPHITEATSRLHADAARQLPAGQAPEPGSWTDPQAVKAVNRAARSDLHTTIKLSDDSPTRIDQKKNVVYQSHGDDPLNIVQELAHRRIFKDPKFEQQFQAHARDIHSGDPSDPRNVQAIDNYVQTRVAQEVLARTEQNEAAAKMHSAKRVSVDPHEIREVEGYGARFELEAHDFVRTGGKTRPGVDYSAGPSMRLAARVLVGSSRENNDNIPGQKPPDLNVVAGTDTLDPVGHLRIERARLDRWEAYNRDIVRSNNSPQDRPQNNLYTVVKDRLAATGLAAEGWSVLPTQTGSPLDQVGCDYAMVNKRTLQVIFLDATQNPEKLSNPNGKNVSSIRSDGVIFFDSRLIDIGGKLKVDEPGRTGDNARSFEEDLDRQLRSLAAAGSPITSDMLPTYWKQNSPTASLAQVDEFRQALNKKAATMSILSQDRSQMEDFARDLGRGASRHNELQAATVESPPLADVVTRGADKTVLDYVLGKMRIKEPAPTQSGSPNVKIHKDGHILVTVDGAIYDGGDVQEAIAEARRSLRADSRKLMALLQRDKAVLRVMQKDHLTIDQMMRRVQDVLVESREVDNGMLGTTDLGLKETIRNRIANNRPEDLVTGRLDRPREKPALEIQPSVFTPEQRAEIPNLAASMAEFNLKVQDGVDPQDLTAFIEMYRDGTTSEPARQLCDQYLADVDKPVAAQRLIPKLHGALVAAQMAAEAHAIPEVVPAETTVGAPATEVKAKGAKATDSAEIPLPFDRVKLALDRLKELEGVASPTDEQLRQIEALRAFQAHVLESPTRRAVASNMPKMTGPLTKAALTMLLTLAITKWYSRLGDDDSPGAQ